jgi:Predicted transcriptional regulator containing an HTH domain and an uncharacterized domain shared with the mammalian protein Schlafen
MDIKTLIKNYENTTFECKKAAGGLPSSVWETYSAFANTNGGIILLGVEEINKKLFVKGVLKTQDLIKDIWDTLNNHQKISINILADRHIRVENVDGMEVIVVEVPRADRHDKPVYIGDDLFTGSYRRNFDGDYHCTRPEIKNMLRDQVDVTQDSKVLANINMDIFNIESIRRYRMRFSNLKPEHVWNPLNQEEFLYKIGAIKRSDEDNKEHPTIAGLLMFGEEGAITEEFPEYFLDYREKLDETNRWTDRITSNSGDWSGNIFDFYYRVVSKLTSDIKVPFKLTEGLERVDDTRVHQAMREALANSLVHSNYYGRQGIVIEKKKDETVISNPGALRISPAEAFGGGISDPRNPLIFKMFSLINIGERAGSGLSNIRQAWEEQNWKKPELVESFEPERTSLKLRTQSKNYKNMIVIGDNIVKENDYMSAYYDGKSTVNDGKATVKKNLNQTQSRILELIDKNKIITIEDMAGIIGITKRNIEKNLKILKVNGMLTRIGGRKKGHWEILG